VETLNPPTAIPAPVRRILVAEDNPQDFFLLKEAFQGEALEVELDCLTDGDQLLERLLELADESSPSYGLVLLDAHLPRRTAEEVLKMLQLARKSLSIPVIVLTTLLSDKDKARLRNAGVSEVLSKPLDLTEYFSLAQHLNSRLT
jgi:CheY-like chemotaxis protein